MKLVALLVVVSACTDFKDVPRDVCGNGLLEAGEDCDSDAPNCVRCAVTCTIPGDCPTADYTCGTDGFCHAPGGVLAEPSAPVTMEVDDFRITDVDGDGTGDVVGVSKTSVIVRHGDATGSLLAADSFVTPAQTGPIAFGDLDGDRRTDVTLTTLDGVVSYTSRFGTLSPVAIESPLFGKDGSPLDVRYLVSVGTFQLATFVVFNNSMLLLAIDLAKLAPNNQLAALPCNKNIAPTDLALATIDLYRATKPDQLTQQFVLSFLTSSGDLCVTAITVGPGAGSPTGFALNDITPTGATALAKKPILADLDNDSDICPDLVSSDGGAQALRHWNGTLANGHCTLVAAGPTGAALPQVQNAPANAVVVGRVPIDPPIILPTLPPLQLAPDALAMTSGLYSNVPDAGAIIEVYNSGERTIAHVAFGDLDNDGDTDIVLSAADSDDLDVLYRFPLGLQLLRIDTASQVTSLTLGDFDGNGVLDIAYTETETDHQNMRVAYGTTDRPLPPVLVASFSGVTSVSPISFPDSVDTLDIATDLAIIHVDADGLPTTSLVHGSPQRTMLSFFDPREDTGDRPNNPRANTVLRLAAVGEFDGNPAHPDVLLVASPSPDSALGMLAWIVPGTDKGLDNQPSVGIAATGFANCDGNGVCPANAELLPWRLASGTDALIAIDRQPPVHAALIDMTSSTLSKTDLGKLPMNVPAGAFVHALYAADVDGDGVPELVASFTNADASDGTVHVCTMSPAGEPQACDALAPVVAQIDPAVTSCIDAAPGHLSERGPEILPTQGVDLVVLCHTGDATALYGISKATGTFVATPLARGTGLRALRVGDVTGDGVDDVVAISGSGGSQSALVFAQCSSREIASCRKTAASGGGQ